eukprot:CAMPEP_0204832244 /NCGR_PEP_ID=MMETSP1346-20131115/12908_1 /ASSEMBLY_ACC=CAM_ASM_000771 /TAXON_ID=215587 /ORGANISM="Aplanochytrium stocchinoi, Strain GSBS06" /LENGTH=257 /DNA_ID=CAMNT_0051963893 /DNA_START=201 /DNA_END=974 /DNA_ORIENTATION=-
MAIFTADEAWDEGWPYGLVGMLACLVGRFVCVVPICLLSNCCRSRGMKIRNNEIFALWYSGLRGGIAFALSTSAPHDLDNQKTGEVFEAATILIVCLTVIVCGSSMSWITVNLNLIHKDEDSSSRDIGSAIEMTTVTQQSEDDFDDDQTESTTVRIGKFNFDTFDNRFLRPFLVRSPNATSEEPEQFREINPGMISPTVNESEVIMNTSMTGSSSRTTSGREQKYENVSNTMGGVTDIHLNSNGFDHEHSMKDVAIY